MKISVLIVFAGLLPLGAQAQRNEQDYRQLVQDFFDAEPPLCLGEKHWPVLSHKDDSPWVSGRLNALVDAGLAQKTQKGSDTLYRLSSLGEKNWHQYGDLCYGHMNVDTIEKIDKVNKEITVVYFTYRLRALEAWAHKHSLRFAFSELDQSVTGVGSTRYSATIRETLGGAAKLQGYPAPVELDY